MDRTGRTVTSARDSLVLPTDDEGLYRVPGLLPGRYLVTAIAQEFDESPLGYGRTFYPGTLNEEEATVVHVDLGREAIADFSMIPARLARVSGVVRDSEGRTASASRITMTPSIGNAETRTRGW